MKKFLTEEQRNLLREFETFGLSDLKFQKIPIWEIGIFIQKLLEAKEAQIRREYEGKLCPCPCICHFTNDHKHFSKRNCEHCKANP